MNPTEEKQKVLKWLRITLIVLAVFLVFEALGALKDLREVSSVYSSISVTGEGEAVSVPDVASFSFTVSVDAKEVSEAQSKVTEKMDSIFSDIETLGVENRDIKTTNYSVRPKYVFKQYPTEEIFCSSGFCPPTSKQVQDGYTVSHSVSVKVRETKDTGKVLALVGENGATNISNISFTVDDVDKVIAEARAEAIKNAKDKAKILAKDLGVRLVRIVDFYDNTSPRPYYAESLGVDTVRLNSVEPTIPVGENKVAANVTIVYEIR